MEKNKHDHKPTKTLKVIIFALFLLAPFFAILSTTAYATLNDNAYKSYYAENINQEEHQQLTNINELKQNVKLNFYANKNEQYTTNSNITFTINNFVDNDNLGLTETPNVITFFTTNGILNVQFKNDATTIRQLSNDNYTFNFNFNYISSSGAMPLNQTLQFLYKINYVQDSFLDNAFYYATNQLEQQSLFNWTQETLIYNVISTTTSGLGINNNAINIIITYEFFIIVIYIIFDIVIEMFTFLTHAITKNN